MFSERLYTDIEDKLDFIELQYHAIITYEDSLDLELTTQKSKNSQVFNALRKIGKKDLLYQMNEIEYINLISKIALVEKKINDLTKTSPIEANNHFGQLFCSKNLCDKFINWFKNNGYKTPSKRLNNNS